MKKFRKPILVSVIVYLSITLIFGIYAEIRYRQNLSFALATLAKSYLEESGDEIEGKIKADTDLHRNLAILKFLPPIGWIINHRVNHIESGVGYIGRNFTLPESERFKDVSECKSFGFGPDMKGDEQLSDTLTSFVW